MHCHVRDPETGKPRRDVALYREVTERIRDADVDVVLNLTAGMGGDMVFGDVEKPAAAEGEGHRHGAARRTASSMCGSACRKSARSIAAR